MSQHKVKARLISGVDDLLTDHFSIPLSLIEEELGFDFNALKNLESDILLETVVKLLDSCAKHTNCSEFGAMLVESQSLDVLGLLPSLGEYTDTLQDAIVKIFDNLSLNTKGINWQLTTDKNFAYTVFYFEDTYEVNLKQGLYVALGQAYKLFKALTNNKWTPSNTYLTHSAPNKPNHLHAVLGKNLSFNMDFSGFIFPIKQLELPTHSANHHINELVDDYIKLSGKSQYSNMLSQIKLQIRSLLLLNQSCSLDEIAASQNKTPRAIQYYLKNNHLSYQKILDKVRYDIAKELLQDSEQSVCRISSSVGFSDSAVFSRAFKKYVGQKPLEYRAKQRLINV